MNITITPNLLHGAVAPPPSKSQAHRLLIAAALADGVSRISNVAFSQDIEATMRCLGALGAELERDGSTVVVRGMGANAMSPLRRLAPPRLDCGESGSTLRFLLPVALAVRGGGVFTGRGRLMERPLGPYFDIFREKGVFYEQKDGVLTVQGYLTPGEYRLPGNVSSQFFTGLLFALPLLPGPSALIPTTRLESFDYIAMTLDVLGKFGVRFPATMSLPPHYHPQGNQTYQPRDAEVERDWSQAAFWYAAGAMGSDVVVEGMDPRSLQGDRAFLDWVRMVKNEPMTDGITAPIYAGADKSAGDESGLNTAPVRSGGCSVSIDVSGCPDLVPPLAAMGAVMNGALYIENAARLRLKESDRLSAVAQVLTAMGANVTEEADRLVILGRDSLRGGVTVDCRGDHRIAMMAAVAATRCERSVTLLGAECVSKSYPDFWEDYAKLGGMIVRS